ncbi:hypothetical protein RND71_022152 [Anisodus tanguticus]|uniref:Uncharacterized protein n=1 Tax=Anisodus tanguticus TaxID=243964 RepID=A0AAE1RXX6_9SOLA|nr:hypothetical protein RND71_022152 [Anisodus tanguticus]
MQTPQRPSQKGFRTPRSGNGQQQLKEMTIIRVRGVEGKKIGTTSPIVVKLHPTDLLMASLDVETEMSLELTLPSLELEGLTQYDTRTRILHYNLKFANDSPAHEHPREDVVLNAFCALRKNTQNSLNSNGVLATPPSFIIVVVEAFSQMKSGRTNRKKMLKMEVIMMIFEGRRRMRWKRKKKDEVVEEEVVKMKEMIMVVGRWGR